MLYFLKNLFIILVLIIIKISFLNLLQILSYINPVIIYIIYLAIKNNKYYIPIALIAGYIMDIYSYQIFGVNILAFTTIAIFSNYIYFTILTNHRFLPLIILIFINIIIFHLIIFTTISILSFIKISPEPEFLNYKYISFVGKEVIYTLGSISLFYFIIKFIQNKAGELFLKK